MGIYDEETIREYIVCNALEMESLDKAVGKVFNSLRERGIWDQALVVFAADHGEMNGEKALVDKGAYLHPRVARVPLVLKSPSGMAPAAKTVETPVCLLDIAPTLLEAAGIKALARLDGMSLRPLLDGSAGAEYGAGRMFIMESHWHVAPNPAVAFQWRKSASEHYFYVYNLTMESDELYDLRDTSYANLAMDAGLSGVKREMVRRLGAFLKSDPRWRCYWHAMRIDKADDLPGDGADYSMFRPE
jgi:arylsulfatase A-like enzyme